MSSRQLTRLILVGLALGIVLGLCVHSLASEHFRDGFADTLDLLPFAFLRLIKMIIAPLVLATLVTGVARMGDVGTAGRIGGKALACFLVASVIALLLGLVLVQVFEPGKALQLAIPQEGAATGVADELHVVAELHRAHPAREHFRCHGAQRSPADRGLLALSRHGHGLARATRAHRARRGLDAVVHIMLKVTGYVMLFAPLAVLGALASTIAKQGLTVLGMYGLLIVEFYLGLAVLAARPDRIQSGAHRQAHLATAAANSGASPACVFHGKLRGGVSADARGAGAFRM